MGAQGEGRIGRQKNARRGRRYGLNGFVDDSRSWFLRMTFETTDLNEFLG